jgi:glycosyltransferase involved in cell wall biosynthesis
VTHAMVDSPRFVWFGPWSPYHNNARYADLLPRLRNVRTIKYPLSTIRLVRGAQLRAYPRILTRAVDGLGRTWRGLFCTDIRQIPHFRERVVVDHDDPAFTMNEVQALNAPNVKLVVLTTERARERLVAEGLRSPTAVVPQGVSLRDVQLDQVSRLRADLRTSGDVVIGYTQPFMFCRNDFRALTAAQEMYCIDDLLDAYRRACAEAPELRLWLIGRPSASVRARTAQMNSVRLCGLVQPNQILGYVANFDIGVYPRFVDLGGRESVKVIQALACGVPVIAANVAESLPVRESGGGILVDSVDDLARAMVRLAKDRETRMALAAKARAFGTRRDWDILARGYDDLLSLYGEQEN